MADFLRIDRTAAGNLARRGAAAKVAQITERTYVRALATAPGSMKEHIRMFMGPGGVGFVMLDHHAAVYVLNGTKPHEIRPRRTNGVLRFTVGSKVVFARKVSHPGTPANNFLLKALLASKVF